MYRRFSYTWIFSHFHLHESNNVYNWQQRNTCDLCNQSNYKILQMYLFLNPRQSRFQLKNHCLPMENSHHTTIRQICGKFNSQLSLKYADPQVKDLICPEYQSWMHFSTKVFNPKYMMNGFKYQEAIQGNFNNT